MFQGFVQLESTIPLVLSVSNSSGTPVNSDALPTYRVYGPGGLMANGTGNVAYLDSKAVGGATATAPIVVACSAHGLTTGTLVTVSADGGLTGLAGTYKITRTDGDHFSLDSSSGSGTYTTGATWNVTGLYGVTLTASAADGYEIGEVYSVFFSGAVSAAAWADAHTFCVT